jgi:peptidoglycan hydrolase CwlO-like protein
MSSKNVTPNIDDSTGMTINLKWLIQIVVVVALATFGYATIKERIDNNDGEIKSLRSNQNKYVFPDIRTLEQQVIQLQKEVLILENEIKHLKKDK